MRPVSSMGVTIAGMIPLGTKFDHDYSSLLLLSQAATVWLASLSRAWTSAEWSSSLPPCAAMELNSSWAVAVLGRLEPHLARRFQRQVQVLLVQADPESRLEGPLDHPLPVQLEDPAVGKSAHQGRPDLRRIGAGLRGEQQGLTHRLDGQRHDDLVGHLAGLAVAVAPDQDDVLAHELEDRV